KPGAAWSGVELVQHTEAQPAPGTAGLVLERHIGLGRIVVTAFRLSEPELNAWPSFDSFANGVLLGRLPRQFDSQRRLFKCVGGGAPDRYDPGAATHVRYFTRDVSDPELKSEPAPAAGSIVPGAPMPVVVPSQQIDSYVMQTELIDVLKGEPGQA